MKHILVTCLFFVTSIGHSQSKGDKIDAVSLEELSQKSSEHKKQNRLDSAIFYANQLFEE